MPTRRSALATSDSPRQRPSISGDCLPTPPKKYPTQKAARSTAVSRAASPAAKRSPSRVAIGAAAEDAAADFLLQTGFVILDRNLRVGRTEIDLLARVGVVIVVVEVRTRGATSYQRALDSIDARKRSRLRSAGQRLWRERFARDLSVERMRFDAISVSFVPNNPPHIEHIKAAF